MIILSYNGTNCSKVCNRCENRQHAFQYRIYKDWKKLSIWNEKNKEEKQNKKGD